MRLTTAEARRKANGGEILENERNNQENHVNKPEPREPPARHEEQRTDPHSVVDRQEVLPERGQYERRSHTYLNAHQ